jgi:hypothetical protein
MESVQGAETVGVGGAHCKRDQAVIDIERLDPVPPLVETSPRSYCHPPIDSSRNRRPHLDVAERKTRDRVCFVPQPAD